MRPRLHVTREDPTSPPPPNTRTRLVDPVLDIPVNASAQKNIANDIKKLEEKLTKLRQVYNITTDPQIRHDVHTKIENFRDEIDSNKEKIIKLKRNASYTQRCKEKKKKNLSKIRKWYSMINLTVLHFFSSIRIYMIIFMIQSNLEQLMKNEGKKLLRCELSKIYARILKRTTMYTWYEQH